MKRTAEFVVRKIQDHDVPALTPFLKKYFYFEETVFKNLYSKNRSKFSDQDLSMLEEDMLNETNYIMKLNCPGIVIAHKETNEIAASATLFAIENPKIKQQHYSVYENFPAKSKLFKSYLDITNSMIEKSRVFDRFPEAKNALELDTVAVDRKYRRQGLYMQLIEASMKYAEDNRFDLIYGLFTSDSSRRAPERLNFKTIANFDLDRYCIIDSKSLMNKTSHNIASVMAKLV